MFTRYLVEKYGMNVQTAYGKLRRMAVRRWEAEGIRRCIHGFDPGYTGKPEDFWDGLEDKRAFISFMDEQMGMGACTAERRFGKFGSSAKREICDFCDSKGIAYTRQVYY